MPNTDVLEAISTTSPGGIQPLEAELQCTEYHTAPVQLTPRVDYVDEAIGSADEVIHPSPTDGTSDLLTDNSMVDFDDSSLAVFLKDVMMMHTPQSHPEEPSSTEYLGQNYHYGRDIFNFGMESTLNFNDLDFGVIQSQNYRSIPSCDYDPMHCEESDPPDCESPITDLSGGITTGAEAFQKSVWRWKPNSQEHAHNEQKYLSIPFKDMQSLRAQSSSPLEPLVPKLGQNPRDEILAMLLGTCNPSAISQVITSFPSADLLDSLIHEFFRAEVLKSDTWLHVSSFEPHNQRPELNGMIVAAGAILSPIPAVQNLGFAIQEAVRSAIAQIVSY